MTHPKKGHPQTEGMLQGSRIYLREVRPEDVNDHYYQWLNDPEVTRYLETRFIPQSKQQISAFVQQKDGNRDDILLAICDRTTGQHIGNIKLGPINWYHRRGDISLFIGEKSYWGKGIAGEAIGLVLEFAFNTLNLNKLAAGAYTCNKGSVKAFLRHGFKIEGQLEEHVLVANRGESVTLLGLSYQRYRIAKDNLIKN
jgi:RimJ/RimL family protein N-acetyltransferase